MVRYDVDTTSYGTKGPYTKIYNYVEMFDNNCGPSYPSVPAPRGYMIKNGECCYADLIENCPYNPVSSDGLPMAQTLTPAAMPQKLTYNGQVTDIDAIPAGTTADFWQSNIYLKQEVPVLSTNYYFDATDKSATPAQLGNFLAVTAGPQFVNATTVYEGQWTYGAQDADMFDVSGYDCSAKCSSSVEGYLLKLTAKKH